MSPVCYQVFIVFYRLWIYNRLFIAQYLHYVDDLEGQSETVLPVECPNDSRGRIGAGQYPKHIRREQVTMTHPPWGTPVGGAFRFSNVIIHP